MTGDELCIALREALADCDNLDDDGINLLDVLDALATAGLPGARELYVELLTRADSVRVHQLRPSRDGGAPG